MKTTAIILLTSLVVLIAACSTSKPHTTTIVAGLVDVTDKNIVRPDAVSIIKLYGFDKDKWNGGSFRFSAVTRVSLNPREYSDIGEANQWLSNDFQRDDEIKIFQKGVVDIIEKVEQTEVGQSNSSIYLPLANELNSLSKSNADRKILLVYSDLMEHTSFLSFYNKTDLARLVKYPESLADQLEKLQALDDLSGIEVYLIYQPADSKSDAIFQLVSGFYKKLLEERGAKVTITASLNI